jgi:hypothetical protein
MADSCSLFEASPGILKDGEFCLLTQSKTLLNGFGNIDDDDVWI